ncbi:hypothetical protein ACEPPN_002418 [Leptodophora sp. 'Broadleaf-Isolate-01']
MPSSTPKALPDEGYGSRSTSPWPIAPIVISRAPDSDPSNNGGNPASISTAKRRRVGRSSLHDTKAKHKQVRMDLGPPINLPVVSTLDTAEVIKASKTIDQYVSAFEISRDPHFLDEIKKLLRMVAEGNVYLENDLKERYKCNFAYGDKISEETFEQVLGRELRSTGPLQSRLLLIYKNLEDLRACQQQSSDSWIASQDPENNDPIDHSLLINRWWKKFSNARRTFSLAWSSSKGEQDREIRRRFELMRNSIEKSMNDLQHPDRREKWTRFWEMMKNETSSQLSLPVGIHDQDSAENISSEAENGTRNEKTKKSKKGKRKADEMED